MGRFGTCRIPTGRPNERTTPPNQPYCTRFLNFAHRVSPPHPPPNTQRPVVSKCWVLGVGGVAKMGCYATLGTGEGEDVGYRDRWAGKTRLNGGIEGLMLPLAGSVWFRQVLWSSAAGRFSIFPFGRPNLSADSQYPTLRNRRKTG